MAAESPDDHRDRNIPRQGLADLDRASQIAAGKRNEHGAHGVDVAHRFVCREYTVGVLRDRRDLRSIRVPGGGLSHCHRASGIRSDW